MNRYSTILLPFVTLAGFGQPATAADGPATADIGWLSGRWVSDNGKEWTEENWSSPKGGVMLGNSKQGKGAHAAEFELLRISSDDKGAIIYWALPGGASAPTPFTLVEKAANHVAFENPSHDYPMRIEYNRDGDTLTAKISGPGGSNPISWSYKRAAD